MRGEPVLPPARSVRDNLPHVHVVPVETPRRLSHRNNASMEIRRRTYFPTAGEALLLPSEAITSPERYALFAQHSLLPRELIKGSPLASTPVPARPDGLRWPAETNPAMFWHPLLWLPESIARPEADEELDLWAVRVSMELNAAGVFDVATGTWLDVLSTVGLDSDDPAVQSRVTAWLQGGSDPDLDRVDLSPLFVEGGGGEEIREAAEGLYGILLPALWAVRANDFISMINEHTSYAEEDIPTLTSDIRTVIWLAQGIMGDDIPTPEGEESPADLWARVLEDMQYWPQRSYEEILSGPITSLAQSFYLIRQDYWAFALALGNDGAEVDQGQPTPAV
ncbi:hypothetical protein ACFVAJ_16960 [Agromyces sp. NPDC057679]|uniref:hypothetical protein n=1 Tax=Agromyces sp. NPDC057679 TaxID=3346207 RepID=UPI00366B4DA8